MYEELEIELRKHLTSTDKLNKKNGKWDYVKAYLLVILDDKYEFSKISNSIEENDKRCCKIYNKDSCHYTNNSDVRNNITIV